MNHDRRQALTALRRLSDRLDLDADVLAQSDGYRVTGLDPDGVDYTDASWDGSDAEASYPNPSDDGTDLDNLADHYLLAPQDLSEDDPPPKSAFKGPIRDGPGGAVNTNALVANIQAINGARGGFEGVSRDTLEDAFQAAVDHLVAAGVYDDADDAPDMDIEAAEHGGDGSDGADFDTGDTVVWAEDTDNEAYGIIRQKRTSGENLFRDDIDGDFALDATDDNPAYLIEILDERDDGWVPTGTMVGHRGETLSAWSPDGGIMEDTEAAVMTATAQAVTFGPSEAADGTLTAAHVDADSNGLAGIIWGAGDHNLSLGGDPTPVRVPQETIHPTFEALRDDVESSGVTLGFDHPDPDSVAAQTGIVDIGTADGVSLSADGQHIVLTDSTLTNDQAAMAAEQGDFDGMDWSVVADVAVKRDGDGDPVVEDGRVVIDATRIRRIDAVDTGAVDAASIERDAAALPDLADEAQVVQDAAADLKNATQAVQALQASATAINESMNTDFDPYVDGDVPEAVQEQLNAAADIIDDQGDELEAAQARANGFERLLTAHGLDEDEFESAADAAQAVIDEQTEDIRAEIADLEADLAAYDVDDVDDRAAELAGSDPADLRNTLNARKAEAFDREQKRKEKGRASARGDGVGRANFSGGDGEDGDADADEVALSAMDGTDRIQAEANGESPSEYVQNEYGLNASQYQASDDLHDDIMETMEDSN